LQMQPWVVVGLGSVIPGGGSTSTWQIGEERRKGEMRQPTIGSGVSRVLTWGNVCPLFRFGAVLRFGTDKRRYSGCADCVDFDLLQISRDSLLQLQVTADGPLAQWQAPRRGRQPAGVRTPAPHLLGFSRLSFRRSLTRLWTTMG